MRFRWKIISLIISALLIVATQFLQAETFYVDQNHPLASDNNPGTESEPFETVQMGINSAAARDTVFIKIGNYNLEGFSKDLNQPITIIGQDKDLTVLDSIGTLNIIGTSNSDIFALEGLKFTNYEGSIFNLTVADGDILDGVYITNCIFDKIEGTSKTRLFLARYDVSPNGVLTNINISNCDFLGLTAPGVKYIYIYEGIISNINILNNNFYNLVSTSDTRGAIAINVGTNSNLPVNKNILISGNLMDTIIAWSIGEIETHGILAYGDSLRILNNTVREMVPGTDHEGIYMKGSYSLIENNVMINSTSHQGAIAIKGSGKSFHDTIRNNRIQSDQSGRGIYTAGPEDVLMENNYVKNISEQSTNGLYIYAANSTACYMKNNYSQTKGVAAYVHDVVGGEITGNTLISYEAQTIKLNGTSSGIYIAGNVEYTGWPVDPPMTVVSADVVEGEVPLDVNFFSTGSIDPNGTIVSYEWNFHDGTISSDPNPSHTFSEVRTYAVTLIVTDWDGFKDMEYVLIRPFIAEETVGINTNTFNDKLELHIYPNPINSFTNISFSLVSESIVNLDVIDMEGKMIRRLSNRNLIPGKHNIIWDGMDDMGRQVANGIYLIKCSAGHSIQTKQVILLR